MGLSDVREGCFTRSGVDIALICCFWVFCCLSKPGRPAGLQTLARHTAETDQYPASSIGPCLRQACVEAEVVVSIGVAKAKTLPNAAFVLVEL